MRKIVYTLAVMSAAVTSPAYAQMPAYYYQGRHKVNVVVKTDTLALKTTIPFSLAARGMAKGIPSITLRPALGKTGRIMAELPPGGVADLTGSARLAAALLPGARPQAVLVSSSTTGPENLKYLGAEVSFRLHEGGTSESIAARYKALAMRSSPLDTRIFIMTVDTSDDLLMALHTANAMQESGAVEWAAPLIEEQKNTRSTYNDPLLPNQWYLSNTTGSTVAGTPGNDLNIGTVWDNVTGDGVNIAISDEGVETSHADLAANARTDIDFDINDNDNDPTPVSTQGHGVACAGVAAARGNNGIGISGVAPKAGIVGLRLLGAPTSDADEATAISWHAQEPVVVNQVFVNSNSWGPEDNGSVLEGPGPLTEAALQQGATLGRGGKGIIYTWAAGNGRTYLDNINKDGYANSTWVIAVGATNSAGTYSYYSEPGSPLLVNAPSGSYYDGLYTTDITGAPGYTSGDYYTGFSGTSAAAPAVAGVVALMLQANPALTCRDVMHVLVDTATKNDAANTGWHTNGSGRKFNHDYGFGRVNATAAVQAVSAWTTVPAPAPPIEAAAAIPVAVAIPDAGPSGVSFTIPITGDAAFRIEHVELEATISHPYRGNLKIRLTAPSGMVSELMQPSNDSNGDFNHWRFRSVAHWGETPSGTWTVTIIDTASGNAGSVSGLILRLGGFIQPNTGVTNWTLY